MGQDEFIAAAVPGAQQSRREHGVPVSVTLAQAILESGWGTSALSTVDKNFFGIKCNGQGKHALGCRATPRASAPRPGRASPPRRRSGCTAAPRPSGTRTTRTASWPRCTRRATPPTRSTPSS
ncbi:glucosaminidase domain-containing protein [Dactylosporangium sp. NPDC049140]|uniref:glucosaminidase domain-containing protein n=1 Tax=Dactylosporangium sp. NPDC049140 TaxID=3155647 RepID=UPI0033CE4235